MIVFAKTAASHRHLSQAFEGREVAKRYLAVVHGHVRRVTGEIAEPLRSFGLVGLAWTRRVPSR